MNYHNTLKDGRVQCELCPRNCKLKNNQEGFCHVRKNINGTINLTTYNYNTGLAIDPIEKKPLYHFYPNSKVLSFGTLGCNMGCQFCQNYHISKSKEDSTLLNEATSEQIVKTAIKYNCKSVAFTYNDPIVFFEYALSTAKLCKENNIKTVAVTAGYINKIPRAEFFSCMDGANIDLKGFSEDFYKKNCLAHIQPVLDTIKYAVNETNCHIELTTLLIEGENDSDDMIKKESDWILSNLGDNIPLHFSAFSPKYKFKNYPQTKFSTLLKARKIAIDSGIKYVYCGNLSSIETSSTYCKNCSKPIIIRDGYKLLEYNIKDSRCIFCNEKVDGHFD